MKTIVTHIGPDLDAIAAVWLVKTFFLGWSEANIAFVPAGTTLQGQPPDSTEDVLHVDTGFGKYDHHQTDADTCATKLVYEIVRKQRGPDPAMERLVSQINDIDHFREVYYPQPTSDVWELSIVSVIDGWRIIYGDNPLKYINLGFEMLDGVYKTFQNKIWAEKEISEKGQEFMTRWGKALAIETGNSEASHLAQKMGYVLVLKRDPKKGYVSVKSLPTPEMDLTQLYEVLRKNEPEATWFLHASRNMVLNGSSKNPDMKPSNKSFTELVKLLTENLK